MTASDSRCLRILPLAAEDIGALIELAGVIWRQHYPDMISVDQIEYMLAERYTPEAVRAQMCRDDAWWDKALIGARMIGFVHYELSGCVMMLNQVYVHQDCQRQGHGGRLLAQVEKQARSSACGAVRLKVNKRNFNSIAAYRKHGYAVVATALADIGGGFFMDDYVMEKTL